MKTLVIHPTDLSTAFLSQIYEGKDWTIINYNPSHKMLKEEIKTHDRIVMLGHGSEGGLFGFNRLIINSTLVYLLKDKEIVAIWCNADKFVEKYDLKGFYTGMIISEKREADYLNIKSTYKEINQSNCVFTNAVTNSIDSEDMLSGMITEYVGKTPTIEYNNKRLYKR